MSPNKQSYNLALVGAGRQGMAILAALVPLRRGDQPLRLVGVADLDPEAPGLVFARRYDVPVFQSFLDLIKLPGLDIVVNSTGLPEVFTELQANCPQSISVLNCDRSQPWEDFWDSISKSLRFTEDYPHLKIGIIGGGKGCQDVLSQTAQGLNSRPRIVIVYRGGRSRPPGPGSAYRQRVGYPDLSGLPGSPETKPGSDSRTHRQT